MAAELNLFDGLQILDLPQAKGGLPLVLSPPAGKKMSAADLSAYIDQHRAAFDEAMLKHGAILFRGFDLPTAEDFETVARAVDNDLKNNYLGTSPRNARSKSGYVFSASELPPYYPIMQHCEMSFLPTPPRKLFFYCAIAPETGGETPLCDFRQVWKQLNPEVRKAFETKGVRTIRNYTGPETSSKFQFRQLKPWHDLLGTKDRDEAEAKCKAEGYQTSWTPDGKLQIINEQPAMRAHPVSGETVWFNHVQVFHIAAAALEYQKIAQLRPSLRHHAVSAFTSATGWLQSLLTAPDQQPMHSTFADGSEIPVSYVKHLLDVIWRNLAIIPWQKGDMVAIDNFSVSHGRLPYNSPREILVCWAAEK